jgi:hypothetical protein
LKGASSSIVAGEILQREQQAQAYRYVVYRIVADLSKAVSSR